MTNIKQKVLQCGAFLLVVSLFVFFYVSSSQQQQGSPSTGKFLRPLVHSRDTVMNITKTILLWKNSWGYRFGKGRSPFLNSGCRVNNCLITDNSTLFPEFDAYVVHPPTQKTPWLLTKRRPDQIFVLFSTEPPYHMPDLNPFENYFNWTMSYRRGSDFRLVYGEIEPLESAPRSEQEILSLRQNVWASGINPARAKTKLAVWLVSNCNARSNRQEYVRILSKYISVDIFSQDGRCGGTDACPRSKNYDVCYNMIEQDYKFYFAFENSICEDYVTEKFFEMLSRGIVPVVMGGADYASIAPSHSYINALDYSPRELAEYLKKLDTNDTLYAEYFWWKPHYRIRNLIDINRRVFCDLCEALHTQPIEPKTATKLNKWYSDDSKCVDYPKFNPA